MVKNVIQILRIIGDKVISGIEEAKPIIQDLEDELNANLAEDVKSLLLKLEGIVNEVIDRVKVLEQEVTDAIAALNNEAGSCIDAADASLDAVLDPAEAKISTQLRAILAANEGNITSISTQIRDIITALDKATDDAISNGVACVKKGSKNVKQCLDDNTTAWTGAVQDALVNLALVLNELLGVAPLIITDVSFFLKIFLNKALLISFSACQRHQAHHRPSLG